MTDADRQPAVEAAARLCLRLGLALVAAAIIAALWAGEPTIVSSALGALLVPAGLALATIAWVS
jgi:hypothetical protein